MARSRRQALDSVGHFQEVPFQRRIRVLVPLLGKVAPTAQALRADVAATAAS